MANRPNAGVVRGGNGEEEAKLGELANAAP